MKVSELIGYDLDYWVGKAEGLELFNFNGEKGWRIVGDSNYHYAPSTDWGRAGLIIEREKIQLANHDGLWVAYISNDQSIYASHGLTALECICRCYISAKYGETTP